MVLMMLTNNKIYHSLHTNDVGGVNTNLHKIYHSLQTNAVDDNLHQNYHNLHTNGDDDVNKTLHKIYHSLHTNGVDMMLTIICTKSNIICTLMVLMMLTITCTNLPYIAENWC